MPQLYTTAIVAPSTAPDMVGHYWIDTLARKVYFAVGTVDAADWLELGDVSATPRFDTILLKNASDGLYYEVTTDTPPDGGAPAPVCTDTPGVA